MTDGMHTVHTQFVIGPVQTADFTARRLFFPDIDSLAGPTPAVERVRSLAAAQATLDDIRRTLADLAPTGDRLFDADGAPPGIIRILSRLQQRRWAEAEAALADAIDDLRVVGSRVDSINATVLAHVANGGGGAIPGAERALQLWKTLWLAHMLGDPARLPGEGFEGTRTDFVSRFWTIGAPSLGFAIPRVDGVAGPGEAHAATRSDPNGETGATAIALRARVDGLASARTELEGLCLDHEADVDSTLLSEAQFLRRNKPTPPDADRSGLKPAQPAPAPVDGGPSAYQAYSESMKDRLAAPHLEKRLSDSTRTLLAEFGLSLASAEPRAVLRQFDVRAARSLASLAGTVELSPYKPSVQLGGYIVDVDTGVFADPMCEPPSYPCHCDLLAKLDAKHGAAPQVYVLGVGRAYRIDQTLSRYVSGELVHAEPILRSSIKKAKFRKLDRTIETDDTTTEREAFEETEATTHNRFDLASEVSNVSRQQEESSIGASVTASYGAAGNAISASASANTSSSSADGASDKTAVQNAKEVINKAIRRIKERVVVQRTVTRLNETERTDSFEINNSAGASTTGFYRAINKEYRNQLVCVGKRMVIRFCMQQPMAYLLYCMASRRAEGVVLRKPVAPKDFHGGGLHGLQSAADVTPLNYALWAAAYGAEGVRPPPGDISVSTSAFAPYTSGMTGWMAGATSVDVPAGCKAISADVSCVFSGGGGRYIHGHVGSGYFSTSAPGSVVHVLLGGSIDSKVAITYRGHVEEFGVTFVVNCVPTVEAMAKWRLEIYKAVVAAYDRQKEEYDSQVQAAQLQAGVSIAGRNPLKNRILVEQELQKFVLGAVYPPLYYRGFDSLKFAAICDASGARIGSAVVPEIDFSDARAECPWITFFTQAFEWRNMTYQFHPYSLAQRKDWCTLRNLEDVDPFFENALTAGYAIVDIPITARMTEPFAFFLETGMLWSGGDMPIMGDPLYQDLAIAIREAENTADGVACEEPWTTLVPTPLVYVDDSVPADL